MTSLTLNERFDLIQTLRKERVEKEAIQRKARSAISLSNAADRILGGSSSSIQNRALHASRAEKNPKRSKKSSPAPNFKETKKQIIPQESMWIETDRGVVKETATSSPKARHQQTQKQQQKSQSKPVQKVKVQKQNIPAARSVPGVKKSIQKKPAQKRRSQKQEVKTLLQTSEELDKELDEYMAQRRPKKDTK